MSDDTAAVAAALAGYAYYSPKGEGFAYTVVSDSPAAAAAADAAAVVVHTTKASRASHLFPFLFLVLGMLLQVGLLVSLTIAFCVRRQTLALESTYRRLQHHHATVRHTLVGEVLDRTPVRPAPPTKRPEPPKMPKPRSVRARPSFSAAALSPASPAGSTAIASTTATACERSQPSSRGPPHVPPPASNSQKNVSRPAAQGAPPQERQQRKQSQRQAAGCEKPMPAAPPNRLQTPSPPPFFVAPEFIAFPPSPPPPPPIKNTWMLQCEPAGVFPPRDSSTQQPHFLNPQAPLPPLRADGTTTTTIAGTSAAPDESLGGALDFTSTAATFEYNTMYIPVPILATGTHAAATKEKEAAEKAELPSMDSVSSTGSDAAAVRPLRRRTSRVSFVETA